MKIVFTYLSSLLLLLTLVVNSQGIFVEHHDCNTCYDANCEVETSTLEAEPHSPCEAHKHSHEKKENHCDLSDFPNIEHQASCTCFAEYIQLPVFYSNIISHKQIPSENIFFLLDDLNVNWQNLSHDYSLTKYHKLPDKSVCNCSLLIQNCSFLC